MKHEELYNEIKGLVESEGISRAVDKATVGCLFLILEELMKSRAETHVAKVMAEIVPKVDQPTWHVRMPKIVPEVEPKPIPKKEEKPKDKKRLEKKKTKRWI